MPTPPPPPGCVGQRRKTGLKSRTEQQKSKKNGSFDFGKFERPASNGWKFERQKHGGEFGKSNFPPFLWRHPMYRQLAFRSAELKTPPFMQCGPARALMGLGTPQVCVFETDRSCISAGVTHWLCQAGACFRSVCLSCGAALPQET